MHPSTETWYRFLRYDHLPSHLQAVSKPFRDTADVLIDLGLEGPHLTEAIKKLFEAKNAAVCSAIMKAESEDRIKVLHDPRDQSDPFRS